MKPTTTAIPFLASLLLTTASPTPSPSTIYTLKIKSTVPAIRNTTLVLKDDVGTPSTPTPLGSFSTGEPRYPYTFTLSPISVRDNLYELRSTAAQTHLILNGDARAPQLFDGVVGRDPAPGTGLTRSRWLLVDQGERMEIVSAEDVAGSNSFRGAGTWRACNQGTVDWSMFWFDGQSVSSGVLPQRLLTHMQAYRISRRLSRGTDVRVWACIWRKYRVVVLLRRESPRQLRLLLVLGRRRRLPRHGLRALVHRRAIRRRLVYCQSLLVLRRSSG
jgi:hypothetical protein